MVDLVVAKTTRDEVTVKVCVMSVVRVILQ